MVSSFIIAWFLLENIQDKSIKKCGQL